MGGIVVWDGSWSEETNKLSSKIGIGNAIMVGMTISIGRRGEVGEEGGILAGVERWRGRMQDTSLYSRERAGELVTQSTVRGNYILDLFVSYNGVNRLELMGSIV